MELSRAKKWQKKSIETIEKSLKKLSLYRIDFQEVLIQRALLNDWIGVVFKDTPKEYEKFLKGNKITNIINQFNSINYVP
jgi:hypothetical protein